MDDVEERREPVDVEELTRQRRGKVEAEAVNMALDRPIAQRVHDQSQDARVQRVERVARAREVHVVMQVVGHEPVVRHVVDALEREHRAEVVALRRVVVDDVEDHLDAGAVQRLDHALELPYLLAAAAGGGVLGVRREVADRAVAPVVGRARDRPGTTRRDVVDRQQLDGRHTQVLEVLERRLGGEPGIGAAQVVAHIGMGHREARAHGSRR